jgi:hypothetical protein
MFMCPWAEVILSGETVSLVLVQRLLSQQIRRKINPQLGIEVLVLSKNPSANHRGGNLIPELQKALSRRFPILHPLGQDDPAG